MGLFQRGVFEKTAFQLASVQIAPTGAGRSRRVRHIYRVKVDGQQFEFKDLAAAITFLNEAKAAAQQLAQQTIANAVKRQSASSKKVEPPSIPMPKIEVSSRDLRGAVSATKREIAEIYSRAMRDAELAIMLELAIRDRDNEDIALLLF